MKHRIVTLITAAGLFLAAAAQAANVAPLGLEIGVATLAQVKARAGKGPLTQTGINAYSDGPMLEGDGRGLDIEGLEKILFIFDRQDKLAAVVMTLGKHRFDEVHRFLAGKYRVRDKQIPFVGDRHVRLTQGDSLVEIEAPHLSFEMEVRYVSNALQAAYKKRSAEAETQRKTDQATRF